MAQMASGGGFGADRRARSTRHVRAGHVGSLSRPASRTAPVVARDNDAVPAPQESAVPADVPPSLGRCPPCQADAGGRRRGGLPHHAACRLQGARPPLSARRAHHPWPPGKNSCVGTTLGYTRHNISHSWDAIIKISAVSSALNSWIICLLQFCFPQWQY